MPNNRACDARPSGVRCPNQPATGASGTVVRQPARPGSDFHRHGGARRGDHGGVALPAPDLAVAPRTAFEVQKPDVEMGQAARAGPPSGITGAQHAQRSGASCRSLGASAPMSWASEARWSGCQASPGVTGKKAQQGRWSLGQRACLPQRWAQEPRAWGRLMPSD